MLIESDSFKQCLARFPTGVSVITTKDSSTGEKIGVTISSLTSLSLNPSLVLFCLSKNAHTHNIFLKEKYFVANILSETQMNISKQFASHLHDKWQEVVYKDSAKTSLPIIDGVIAYLECKNQCNYDGGDHTIFLGEVINLEILCEDNPLIHYKSKYYSVSENIDK